MRRVAVSLVAAAAALVAAPFADAKLCATLRTVPAHPRAGALVELKLTTWLPAWDGGSPSNAGPAVLPASSRIGMDAYGPGDTFLEIRYRRSAARPSVWRVKVRFPRAGRWWLVEHERWGFAPKGCGPTRWLRVAE